MAAVQFDMCYLQGLYAPVEAVDRTREIGAFLASQSNDISCVPFAALISAQEKALESLNVPRILLRIAACCSCVAEDAHEHNYLELAVASAAHLLSAAATYHAAAAKTGKRRRSNHLKGYKPSTVVELWRQVKRQSNSESSDALLLLLVQASTRMLPFTNSSDVGDVVCELMTDCLSVAQKNDATTCWLRPRSKSWLVNALDEQTLVQLLRATSKDEVLHTAACHALRVELQRLLACARRSSNADTSSATTSKMVATLLQAAAEAGGLSTLLAIAPPDALSRCSTEKAAAVRKACCACFCAMLKPQQETSGVLASVVS